MIDLNPFSKTYQQKTVLSFPGFSFAEGKIYAIIGSNGSGKSTFARITAGLLKADEKRPPFAGQAPALGYLPQKPYPFRMSIRKNLLLNGSGNAQQDEKRISELLAELDLNALANEKANRLSGGESAKMALARLLMKDYPLLILDEPSAAMDIHSTLRAESLIRSYCRRAGSCVILITHSLKQARRIADAALFFQDGQLVEHGPAQDVLTHPKNPLTEEFLEFYSL